MRIELTTDDRFSKWLIEPISMPRWVLAAPLAVALGFLAVITVF